ncbi:hypothetical protein [Lysobacter humi (ex Lee et al. 2017)]
MNKTYDDVRIAFDTGSVAEASKVELEQLLLAIGRERIQDPINQARASQMGETMRQLLAARQSQEMHGQALRISKLALWVSALAFVASLAQLAVAVYQVRSSAPPAAESKRAPAVPSGKGPNNSSKPTPLRGAA